jgi:hypothetical protein
MHDLATSRRIDATQADRLMKGAAASGDEIAWGVFSPIDKDPAPFVACPFIVTGGRVTAMPVFLAADSLEQLRDMLPAGLVQDEGNDYDEGLLELWNVQALKGEDGSC